MQQKLTEIGITPSPPSPELDLKDALRDNLAQLPAPVKELVERITKPQPPLEKDAANKLKQQVSTLRDLSQTKQTLQSKIDATKKAFQDLLDEMKNIQSKIEQEQAELNSTSTAYMSLVSKQPDPVQLSEDADMKDPVPFSTRLRPAWVPLWVKELGRAKRPELSDLVTLTPSLWRPPARTRGTSATALPSVRTHP